MGGVEGVPMSTTAIFTIGFVVGMFAAGAAMVWLFHDYEAERPPHHL